jgi:uncharacterized protein (DUF1015 family)
VNGAFYKIMATINPFRPLRPNQLQLDRLVFADAPAERLCWAKETETQSLQALLEIGAGEHPEMHEDQSQRYSDISNNLDLLIERESLLQEETPSIYLYEVTGEAGSQTGIWGLADVSDYISGEIKIHELTIAPSVRRLKNYRKYTGLEGSPVLLTYPAQNAIQALIPVIKAGVPAMVYRHCHQQHRLWKIKAPNLQRQLIDAFAGIKAVYLADGHHRLESALQLAIEQSEAQLPVFDKISALYVSMEELQIERFYRVIKPEVPIHPAHFFRQLKANFRIRRSTGNKPIEPTNLHDFGLLYNGRWYHLQAKARTYAKACAACRLDPAILQDRILSPVFGIEDPKTDQQLQCIGGRNALREIVEQLKTEPGSIVFTLCPLTPQQLVAVADVGGILPPKSTWIVPKIPFGLLIQQHQTTTSYEQ